MENVYKVTLQTGRVVHLREMKMKYEDMALNAIGQRGKNQPMLQQKIMGDELMKILLIDLDGVKLTPVQLEKLDDTFSYSEISEIRTVMTEVTGANMGELGASKIELVKISGAQ